MQSDTRPPQRLIGNLHQSIKFRRDLMSYFKIIAIGTVTFHRFVLKISVHTPYGYFSEYTRGWRPRTAVSAWHWKAPICTETRRWHSAY